MPRIVEDEKTGDSCAFHSKARTSFGMFCFYEPWLRLLTELVVRGIHSAAHCIELHFRLHSTYSAMQLT